MRVISLGESQESSTLVELRGTRVLIDAGLGLAASARLVRGEVEEDGECLDVDVDDHASTKKRKTRRHRKTTGRGEFLISPPAYRTALFEATDCGAIDAVLVTSAAGLLGLPYLVQAAAEAVGGAKAVAAGDPRAGGVSGGRRRKEEDDEIGSEDSDSGSLPAFLDPPFEVFATDLAVEMALAWISELGAASAAAASAGEEDDDDEGGEEAKRPRGANGARRSSPSIHPLAGLPAPVLASLTEGARRDLLGGGEQLSKSSSSSPLSPLPLFAWRKAYPAALARALLSSTGGGESRSSSGGGNIRGRVVTRVSYGERARLRGGALFAVASPAGVVGDGASSPPSASAAPPGSAVWTLVDAVAETSASLSECSGGRRGAEGQEVESGVARVVCVGACGGLGSERGAESSPCSSSSSSAAAPLDVSSLRGAHVLVLAPPEEPPPQIPWPVPSSTTTPSSPSSCFALAAAAAASALDRGGNALFPVPSAGDGRALELVEAVLSALAPRLGGSGGGGSRSNTPLVVFASPGAKRATAASCASAEWLCAARSALALSGRPPYFAGAAAAAAASVIGGGGGSESNAPSSSNRSNPGLVVADSLAEAKRLHGWREPCVAFVPASSLFNSGSGGGGSGGGGDGAALLRSWGRDPRSAVVFSYSLSDSPSGVRLSELVSRAFPRMRARIVDVEAEVAASREKKENKSLSRARSLASFAAAVSPRVLVLPRRWERAISEASADSPVPLGKACARIEPLQPLIALELTEGTGEGNDDVALPAPLSRAGVTSELASAAAKNASETSPSSRVLALATLRDGEVELDAPPGAGTAGGGAAAVAAALVVARPPSSSLDVLLSELGAPPPPSIKVEGHEGK